MRIARAAYRTLCLLRSSFGLSDRAEVRRKGIAWALDLSEGIDLSIYLLGAFEIQTLRACEKLIRPGTVVLDIGANVGAHTLHFARLVGPQGRVYAYEPTDFAYSKLRRNIELNPSLAGRITARRIMLAGQAGEGSCPEAYASWPLRHRVQVHEKHGGRAMTAAGAQKKTLDACVTEEALERVDFIKIDVDGDEDRVISGGTETLRRHRPLILMELAPYVYGSADRFDEMMAALDALGYHILDLGKRDLARPDGKVFRERIKDGSSWNVLLVRDDAEPRLFHGRPRRARADTILTRCFSKRS